MAYIGRLMKSITTAVNNTLSIKVDSIFLSFHIQFIRYTIFFFLNPMYFIAVYNFTI